MLMEELLNHIKTFLECSLVSVFASILSIFAAFFTFIQYKNTIKIKRELERKMQNYDKAQLRGKLRLLIEKIVENLSNPKKLLIGGKLNKDVTQVFSDIRSDSIYSDPAISTEIKKCEEMLKALGEGNGSIINLKDVLCDLSRAIDNSVKE